MSFDASNNFKLPNSSTDQTPKAPTAYVPAVFMDAPGSIGSTTPGTGAFTTLSCTTITSTGAATLGGNTTVTGTLGVSSDLAINTNKFNVTAASGNTTIAGTLGVTGDVAVNTNKFTVAASSGNTVVAGTLGVTGDVAVNTNKFTVAASSGNTAVAGTLSVAALLTATLGLDFTSAAVTATSDGLTTGIIAAGQTFVTAANGGSADNIVTLPSPSVGHIVMIKTTGILELRSSTPASISINGGSGASAESALPANCLAILVCVSSTAWLGLQIASNGSTAGIEAAA